MPFKKVWVVAISSSYRIKYNSLTCVGDAVCTAVSSNWTMGPEGKAHPVSTLVTDETLENNLEAAKLCPFRLIRMIKVG